MTILIVDDSKAMRMIVRRTIRQAGFEQLEIEEADDGAAALAALKAKPAHLILSDWNMPNMTGIDFLRALRATGDQTPFGFVTSERTEDRKSMAMEAGARFLIAKPFTPDDFRKAVAGVLP